MNGLMKVSGVFDNIARTIGKSAGWVMLPLIAVIMFDVVTRKLDVTRLYFSEWTATSGYSVSTILQDAEWHFHAVLLMLSFGFGYLANAHVRVDVFRELLPRRKQAWMEFVLLIILGLPFLTLMISYGWTLFHISWLQNEGSDSLTGINWRWAVKFFVPFGFVVVMLATIATILRLAVYLFGSEFQSKEAEDALAIFADDFGELEKARLAAEEALRREAEEAARLAKGGGA